jgi:putative endonuclease
MVTGSKPSSDATGRARTGQQAEERAAAFLQRQGLRLLTRNYRVALGPYRRGGEIDLILQDRDGTVVFVEVRARAAGARVDAAASVNAVKQRRVVHAAQHYLQRWNRLPPCRFDVVAVDGEQLQWLQAAFEAG